MSETVDLAGYADIKAKHTNGETDWQIETPDPADCSIAAWLGRDIPDADLLLGPFSTTSRGLFSADTGLGKTNFCMALAAAMAEGRGAYILGDSKS